MTVLVCRIDHNVRGKEKLGPRASEEGDRGLDKGLAMRHAQNRVGYNVGHTPKTATLLTTAAFSEDVTAS